METPAPGIVIRRAASSDADAVLQCLHTAFEPYRTHYTDEAFHDTVLRPATIHERLARMCVFVAVAEGGEVVGTIGCEVNAEGDGHLRGMAILPGLQGSGLADR